MRYLLLLILLAGCSSSDNRQSNPPAPVSVPTTEANAAQVQQDGMFASGRVPPIEEVFVTDNEYWMCAFGGELEPYWSTVFYVDADGTGRSVMNIGFNGFEPPETYNFTWAGDQIFYASADWDSVTLYDFKFETNPDFAPVGAIYHFVSTSSQTEFVVCTKYAGRWEDL